jgi:MFS family permease
MFIPTALCSGLSMQIGGRLTDRMGPRIPVLIGLSIGLVAALGFALLTLTTPLWVILVLLGAQGLGHGMTVSPLMVAGISQLPKAMLSQASAMRQLTQQVSGALAVAILGAIVAVRLGSHPTAGHAQAAYNAAFLAGAIGVLIAWFVAYRLPRGVPDLDGDLPDSLQMDAAVDLP